MKAEELLPGDVLPAPEGSPYDGPVVYEVVEVFHGEDIVATVKFTCDGGEAVRSWAPGTEVPHVRPA